MKPRPLIVGNWKMNGLSSALQEAYALNDYLRTFHTDKLPDVILCPPVTLLMTLAHKLIEKPFALGAQDCHIAASGPHTGDISAEMLADAGASAIIAGHSERRYSYAETDSQVQAKQSAIHRAGLVAIICVGETLGQRLADITLSVVERQLEGSLGPHSTSHNTVVAYEPVWAIGSGMTPTLSEVSEVHSMIRSVLTKRFNEHGSQMRILYGGSVNPKNAGDLLSVKNVDGALVGGASLKSENFIGIISANNGK